MVTVTGVDDAAAAIRDYATQGFDLVIALTGGGPGYATDMPATFMYALAFQRSELGVLAFRVQQRLAFLPE